MVASPSTATPQAPHSFERRVEDTRTSKNDINFVILDYLISEGYPAAAKKFADEANIASSSHPSDVSTIHERVAIKEAILQGNVQEAMEGINDVNPELLDQAPSLLFALLRLQLIELIRKFPTDPTPALEFAQAQLAPIAPTHPSFLRDLEQTMALLIFPSENLTKDLKGLLDPELRRVVASEVNQAILEGAGQPKSARLQSLIKLRAWAEKQARTDDNVKAGLPEKMGIWGTDGSLVDTVMGGSSDGSSSSSGSGGVAGVAS